MTLLDGQPPLKPRADAVVAPGPRLRELVRLRRMAVPSRPWLASVTALIVTLTALAVAERSLACSCGATPLKQRIERSDAAITARLVNVVQRNDWKDYIYRVRHVRKGTHRLARGQVIHVVGSSSTGGSADTCAAPARVGRVYSVFLERLGGRWSTNLCSVDSPEKLAPCGRR